MSSASAAASSSSAAAAAGGVVVPSVPQAYASGKACVLILGGCGFVGRHLLRFLLSNDLVTFVRAADKAMPQTAVAMSPDFEKLYEDPRVEYKQCNLTNPASLARVFEETKGPFDFVINCAAETKYGQPDAAYKDRVLDLSVRCAQEAAKHKIARYVELSTGQIYKPESKPKKEGDKEKPFTRIAVFKQQAEQEIAKISGLPLVILRPGVIYGPMDVNGIAPRVLCGAVYKYLEEKMKFLWTKDLRIHTVHVRDVVRAIWFVCVNDAVMARPAPRVLNVVDKNDTDQGKINALLEQIFGIKTSFQNMVMNGLAKASFSRTAEFVNDKHLSPWMELCKSKGIASPILSPFIDEEVLIDNPTSLDGSALEALGFKLDHPQMTRELVQEQVDHYIANGWFPKF